MLVHVVKKGESIATIAEQYGVSIDRIVIDNSISNINELVVGEALIINFPLVTHIVGIGETLEDIANEYEVGTITLLQNNPNLIDREYLVEGEAVVISYSQKQWNPATINGYAYTYINDYFLKVASTYMSTVTVFGYGFTESGSLIEIDDERVIQTAGAFGAKPVMLLCSVDESGDFNTAHAERLFANYDATTNLIQEILAIMPQKGYIGLDLDFEFVSSKELFINFISRVTEAVNAQGYFVNVDLAPKTSSTQQGLLYEAHDYKRIGEIVNTVLLMTYEWGYLYGPPMAVAPINQVTKVLEYALTEIPKEKIMIGIPNYAYDWPLPFVKGQTVAEIIGNEDAKRIAYERGTEILFDETAMTPYFYYTDDNQIKHVVWFEDVRSIIAKLELITIYDIRGAGYWNLMKPFRSNYVVLNGMFAINKL